MIAKPPSSPWPKCALAALVLAVSVAGCSSGSSSDDASAGIDRGGSQISTVAVGKITAFGSVVVNGVRWSTDSADIVVDGGAALETDLAIGQIVRIEGTRSSETAGAARRIEADDLLEGVVESLDATASRLTVLGREILVDASTVFEGSISPRSLDGLAVGQFVEVSGFLGSDGTIRATYIELDDDDDDDSRIRGVVSNLDTGALTFEIDGLTVDYSSAALIELPEGMPSDGLRVAVRGSYDPDTGVLLARELRSDGLLADFDDDAEVDIEGIVTRFTSVDDFAVAGVAVTTTAQTEFDDGAASGLALDVLVEVEGRFNAEGVLVATEVELEDGGDDGSGASESSMASEDDYICPPSPVSGVEIESNVSVEGICAFDNVTVRGQVTVQPGAEFTAVGSRIDADLQSLSAAVVDVEGSSIGGNIDIKETSIRLRLVDVSSRHNILLEKNAGRIHVERFSAGQDFQLKESSADILVTGEALQNAQLEKNSGGVLTADVGVGQDAQVKENTFSGASDVTVRGGDQAQCLDNNFDVYAEAFESVDGCVRL